jgi:hypothetical protein
MGSGWGSWIFNIPFVGPIAYYLLAPFPESPLSGGSFSWETAMRSIGSICYMGTFAFTFLGVSKIRVRGLLPREFYYVALTFLLLFFATVASADDPRYKQPTNFFLAMMAFMVSRSEKETKNHNGRLYVVPS